RLAGSQGLSLLQRGTRADGAGTVRCPFPASFRESREWARERLLDERLLDLTGYTRNWETNWRRSSPRRASSPLASEVWLMPVALCAAASTMRVTLRLISSATRLCSSEAVATWVIWS